MSTSEHLIGRVKWFNTKVGYGFITVTDGSRSGTDVFVYHTSINVENQQYKYLVQGEYVEFDLVKSESGNHEWQADRVGGIKGGKLMCETRREVKLAREPKQESRERQGKEETRERQEQRPRQRREERPRQRQEERPSSSRPVQRRPKESTDENTKDWTLVKKNIPNKYRVNQNSKGETVITIKQH